MNDNINHSNSDNYSIPVILIEEYYGSQPIRGHSGERTPISSHVGSITSDELSVTSSQTSQKQKSHLSGRRLRLRLQALLKSKTDKQQKQQQQFNTNIESDPSELTTGSSSYANSVYPSRHLSTDGYDGTKSANYDAIPPVPKFNETSPERNSENEFKYSGRADDDHDDDSEDISERERKGDNHTELLSPSYFTKYAIKSIKRTQPKHHADTLYERHHVILEEKALMNTANTSTGGHHGHHHNHHNHHHHHHHHHHHKTRSNKNLTSTLRNVLQKDNNSKSSVARETMEKNNPVSLTEHKCFFWIF
ncbi:unnamed protein product [Schistosoma turkestanicum]|nr:unnamed protein product [Schistosoma turkestanicum]